MPPANSKPKPYAHGRGTPKELYLCPFVYLELLIKTSHWGFIKAFYNIILLFLFYEGIKGREKPLRISVVFGTVSNKDVLELVISVKNRLDGQFQNTALF